MRVALSGFVPVATVINGQQLWHMSRHSSAEWCGTATCDPTPDDCRPVYNCWFLLSAPSQNGPTAQAAAPPGWWTCSDHDWTSTPANRRPPPTPPSQRYPLCVPDLAGRTGRDGWPITDRSGRNTGGPQLGRGRPVVRTPCRCSQPRGTKCTPASSRVIEWERGGG